MTSDNLPTLDVFYGDLTFNRAYIYARLPRPVEDAGLSLVGQVRGPRCLHAETLPMTSPLVDLGPGPTLLARALVPDPCCWSPDLPAIYDVTVNLLRGTEIVGTARRELGLRSLGVRGRNLFLEGKRWVLRGVHDRSTSVTLPRAWHELNTVLVTAATAENKLAEASQFGTLTVVELPAIGSVVAQLRELSRQPGVAMAIVRGSLPRDFRRSDVAPNLLLVQQVDDVARIEQQPWADALLTKVDDLPELAKIAQALDLPILVCRPLAAPLPLDQARAACDTLQRDLAPLGQFAGYIV